MRSKLNFLINSSLKRKIKTKWFLVANIIIAVLIVGIINVDSIIKLFGGDFDEKTKVYVIDNTNVSFDVFENNLKEYSKSLDESGEIFEVIQYKKGVENAKEVLTTKEKDSILIVLNNDQSNIMSASIISSNSIDTYNYQIINTALNTTKTIIAINELGLTNEEYNKISSPIQIERERINSDSTTDDENMEMVMTTVFPVIILPFFMLSIFLIQMIGAEVNDEKTTKSMEIIISNVSPKTHFFSKVIAGNLFVIFQAILLLVYSVIGLYIRKLISGNSIVNGLGDTIKNSLDIVLNGPIGDKLVYIIPLTLLLMLITFVAYSLVAGIFASMTTNTEDFQQVQTPMVIISVIGYYLAVMAGVFKGATFIKILSFVPFISAILSPSLLVLGQIGIFEIIISILIMIVFIFVLIKYGLKIYKVGILNYSQTSVWKKIINSIKK